MQSGENGKRLSVLLFATNWVPIPARLAIRFVRYGCSVSAVCPRGHLLNHVGGMASIRPYDPFDLIASQAAAIERTRPDVIVPCDDAAVWQLHETHQRYPNLRDAIEKSIGTAAEYPRIRSRVGLLNVARDLGVRIPETHPIHGEGDLRSWSFRDSGPAVLKRSGTSGGQGVQIVHSDREATDAYRFFNRTRSRVVKWKRHLVNRDPLAFWQDTPERSAEVSLQQYIPGRPANVMLLCWRGRVVSSVTVEALATQGTTGAGTIIRFIENAEIAEASSRLAGRLGLSGFHGFDFILDEATGAPLLIEMNPRCTQLGHFIRPDREDLASAFCRLLGGERASPPEAPLRGDVVSFFPQALAWNSDSPYFLQSHQDIPWGEPALIRELLRASWPERRWLIRAHRRLAGRVTDPKPRLERLPPADRIAIQKLLGHGS